MLAKRLYVYHMFAKEYGWSPDIVDKLPYEYVIGLLAILRAEAERAESEFKVGNVV